MTRKEREILKEEKLWIDERKDWSDEQKTLDAEISCMDMIDSIMCYGKQDFDYIITNDYLQRYIDELGIEHVKTLIINQLNEKPYIKRNVATDSEGLTYNSMFFKDDEGYIYE